MKLSRNHVLKRLGRGTLFSSYTGCTFANEHKGGAEMKNHLQF